VGATGLLLVAAGIWWFVHRPVMPPRPPTPVAVVTETAPAQTPPPPSPHLNPPPEPAEAATPAPAEEQTVDEFAIGKIRLEHERGTSLFYAVGRVRNLTDHQRFGVKVKLKLYSAQDDYLGDATDYQAVIEPHAVWKFKALVLPDQAASAAFDSVTEDK
jgi:hypothetical protein